MVKSTLKLSRWFGVKWVVNPASHMDTKNHETKKTSRPSVFQRRYLVTLLGFLCSVVMHSHRLNISIAMVAMVNTTRTTLLSNSTECPLDRVVESSPTKTHVGEFSWNPELQGYVLSAGFLGYVLTQIPGGILTGHLDTRPILVAGLMAASVCNLLSPASARAHPHLLMGVTLVRGMAQGIIQPAMSVLMSKWFPKSERGFLSAFIYCGYPVGAFVTSVVSGVLCDQEFLDGWPLVFYTFGIAGVFVSVLLLLFFIERPADDPRISEKELKHIVQNQESSSFQRPPTPWAGLLTSLSTYALILALFGQYWMAFYFLSVHPTYMGTILNIPIKENGILSSGPHLAQAFAGFAACWLSFVLSRSNRAKVNTIRKTCNTLSCVVFTAGMVGVYFSGCDRFWNEVCLFIATAGVGFSFAGSLITAVDMSPTYCGALMGFASTVASLAGFVVPVILGVLTNDAQTLVQWRKMFLITASVSAGSGLVFLLFGSTDIQPWDQTAAKKKENSISDNKKEDNDLSTVTTGSCVE